MDKIDAFFQRLQEVPAPGEERRVAAVRTHLLQDNALRSASIKRLADNMNDPLSSFFLSHQRGVELSPDSQQAFLNQIIAEGRRRHAVQEIREPHSQFLLFGKMRLVVSTLIVFLGAATTLTVAAESSLPGDTLYPLKTEVIEPIVDTVQFTSESRAAWAERKVERRLREATALHMFHQDNEEALYVSATGIEREVVRASRLAHKLGKGADQEIALDLQADVEAALDAHEITSRYVYKGNTPVTDVVRQTKRKISEDRRESEQRFIETSQASLPAEVKERTQKLIEALDDIRENLAEGTGSVLDEEAASLANTAEKMLDDVNQLAIKEDRTEAFLRAESALRLTEEAENLLENSDDISAEEILNDEDVESGSENIIE